MSNNRMKRIGSKILVFVILAMFITGLFSNSFGVAANADFYDMKGSWSERAIEALIEKGIVTGSPVNGVLEAMPDKSISRAEFVAIVVRAFNLKPVAANIKTFKDDIKGSWYMEPLKAATSNSLIAGYPDGGFHPNDPLTNEHVSIVLTRLRNQQLKSSGKTVNDSWYVANVLTALRAEFALVPKDSFVAKNNATRAETFAALYSFMKITENAEANTLDQATGGTPQVVVIAGGGNDPSVNLTNTTGTDGTVTGTAPATPVNTGVLGYDISAAKGDLVYFQIYAYMLTELGGFDFKISYDPKVVVATSVRNGSIKEGAYIKDADVDLSQASDGIVCINNRDTSAITGNDGVLFTVVFRVQPEATGNSIIAMKSSSGSAPLLYNIAGSVISPVTCSDGKITVK